MTDDIEARVARVLAEHVLSNIQAKDVRCKCGWSVWHPLWDSLVDLHRAHVASVLAEAGLLPVETPEWFDALNAGYKEWQGLLTRAEKAEALAAEANAYATLQTEALRTAEALVKRHAAAHADLVARIEALADEWDEQRKGYPATISEARVAASAVKLCGAELRAALRGDGEATT